MTKPLDTSDLHHLHAAEGWFELGLHLEANGELEQIAPESRGQARARMGDYGRCRI